jgi:hypothetical protein
MATRAVDRAAKHVSARLCVLGHLVMALLDRREAVLLVTRLRRGQEVDDEGEDVEDVDGRDDPFDDRCGVVDLVVSQDAECDDEEQLEEDEE